MALHLENCDYIGLSAKGRDHDTTTNPRAGGFNYRIGWGSEPKPAIFEQGRLLATRLADQANEASRAAWTVEHALAVRLAETDKEKADAAAALTAVVYKYPPSDIVSTDLHPALRHLTFELSIVGWRVLENHRHL